MQTLSLPSPGSSSKSSFMMHFKQPSFEKEQKVGKRKSEYNQQECNFVVKTSHTEKKRLDIQVGRYIYATNSSFRSIEHPEFKKLVSSLRPGYTPPSSYMIGNQILTEVYKSELESSKTRLSGRTVCMDLDGWSNINNEPVLCASITTEAGNSYLVKTIDTSGYPHDTEYLTRVARDCIRDVSQEFGVNIRSFVTDSAANMRAMRRELLRDDDSLVPIAYGCSAHLANLLAKDLDITEARNHVVQVVKYVRNTHDVASQFKKAAGKKMVIPGDTRWNSVVDCLYGYVTNWPILVNLKVTKNIEKIIIDINIKKNAEDLLGRLKPIAKAIDSLQSNKTKISQAVEIWKCLKSDLDRILETSDAKKIVDKRYKQAITEFHLIANILDPRYQGKSLTSQELDDALNLCGKEFPSLLTVILKFRSRAEPFNKNYAFQENIITDLCPTNWWEIFRHNLAETEVNAEDIMQLISRFLVATASSASIERVFSRFGLVHSKLRNRLGVEKAGRLVFIYKTLNEFKESMSIEDDDC